LAVTAVLGVPACSNGAEAIEAAERSLLAEVGPPLSDAVVRETPWYRNASIWYDHRSDVPAVLDWLEELPRRLGCERFEADDLKPPALGRSQLYRVTCHLDRNGRGYVVSLQTLLAPTYASTVIAAYHEPG
jgi:hypothetical protein